MEIPSQSVAIIPARGGSVRIPGKNIRSFLGKPIIAYSIEVARQSGLFDEVMVSTDDEAIARIAEEHGASVPFLRSRKNSDDYATLSDVVDEVVSTYHMQEKVFGVGCCILPTAPFITINRLREALILLRDNKFDSVRPIVKFNYPIQRALRFTNDHQVGFFNPEFAKSRSQDLEPAYHDAGQFYWFKTDQCLKGTFKGAIEIPELEHQDIDTIEDWQIAEYKYKFLKTSGLL